MKTKANLSRMYITRWLKHIYELNLEKIAFIPEGECSWNYIIGCDNGRRYVLKIKQRGLCADEINTDVIHTLNALYYDHGIRQMNKPPLRARTGKYINRMRDYQALVIPYIAGEAVRDTIMTDNHQRRLGSLLGTLHMCKLAAAELPPVETFDLPNLKRLARIVREARQPAGFYSTLQSDLLRYVREHQANLLHLVNRLRRAQKRVMRDPDLPQSFVLSHGEPSSGNIIVTPDEEVYLIDWDQPMLAPRERDLFHVRQWAGVLDGYKRMFPEEITLNRQVMQFYKLQWEVNELIYFAWRIVYGSQGEAQNQHDFDKLMEHVKGLNL